MATTDDRVKSPAHERRRLAMAQRLAEWFVGAGYTPGQVRAMTAGQRESLAGLAGERNVPSEATWRIAIGWAEDVPDIDRPHSRL